MDHTTASCRIPLLERTMSELTAEMQDASSSMDTLRALSRMSGSGMNIITVIHQPRYSLYELFDDVLLLGAGGVTVYCGPPLLSELWFTRNGFNMPSYENVADWNLDIISGCALAMYAAPNLHRFLGQEQVGCMHFTF
jgi:hypothetical protein